MAIALTITYPQGTTTDQYDKVVDELGFDATETHGAPGAIFHWAENRNGQLVVHDVWESRADFDTFVNETLAPIAEKAGMAQPTNIEETEVYNYLTT